MDPLKGVLGLQTGSLRTKNGPLEMKMRALKLGFVPSKDASLPQPKAFPPKKGSSGAYKPGRSWEEWNRSLQHSKCASQSCDQAHLQPPAAFDSSGCWSSGKRQELCWQTNSSLSTAPGPVTFSRERCLGCDIRRVLCPQKDLTPCGLMSQRGRDMALVQHL